VKAIPHPGGSQAGKPSSGDCGIPNCTVYFTTVCPEKKDFGCPVMGKDNKLVLIMVYSAI